MTKRIIVLGSLNLDIHIPLERIPIQGETISLLQASSRAAGGKGANQAVAAQRLGAQVDFIGAVGSDSAGKELRKKCQSEGINVEAVDILENENTGQAFIILEPDGHNTIMVEGGANKKIGFASIEKMIEAIQCADVVIAQLETNIEPIIELFHVAQNNGVLTILNPAPITDLLPDELLYLTDIIIPNETEATRLTKLPVKTLNDYNKIAKTFADKKIKNTVITLGERGVYYNVAGHEGIIAAHKVVPVDTTAAGDTFIGAFAVKLQSNLDNVREAIDFANTASSLAVQRMGAMDSIPFQTEIKS